MDNATDYKQPVGIPASKAERAQLTKEKTMTTAYEDYPLLTGDPLQQAISALYGTAKELGGIEVAYPDWPEANEAAREWPEVLHLGPARGPNGWWRRLEYTEAP